jgi:PPOX class probable F420-dependent enzyme
MAVDPRMLDFVADNHGGVLVTLKRDGRPQLSNVGYAFDRDKTRNLARDPRVSLHVTSKDFWTWVVVEGTAELTPVAEEPGDATVEELITYYRAVNGEHPDWDDYRAAMVRDRRLVVRLRPEHTYGQVT